MISPIRGLARLHLPDAVLANVRSPTVFIWGGRDPFGGEAVGRALVERMPDATFDLMPEAGHSPWLDDMDACVAKMTGFLGGRQIGSGAVGPDLAAREASIA